MGNPIWHRDGERYVFHHTTPEAAELIATGGVYVVGLGHLFGPTGVHAGAEDPETLSVECVMARYFFKLWPAEALGGVVVFAREDELQPFEQVSPSTWVLPAPVGELDVADVVVGWGHRGPDGLWWWSAGILA